MTGDQQQYGGESYEPAPPSVYDDRSSSRGKEFNNKLKEMEPGDIINIESMEEVDEELLKVISDEGSDVTYKLQVTLFIKGLKL